MIDEGPSSQDLDRFGGDEAYCPECGAEMWVEASVCPSCGTYVDGQVTGRRPGAHSLRRRWVILVTVVTLAAFLLLVLGIV